MFIGSPVPVMGIGNMTGTSNCTLTLVFFKMRLAKDSIHQ
jgi:hypothetical protein